MYNTLKEKNAPKIAVRALESAIDKMHEIIEEF